MHATLILLISLVVNVDGRITSWNVDKRRTAHRDNHMTLTEKLITAPNKTRIKPGEVLLMPQLSL